MYLPYKCIDTDLFLEAVALSGLFPAGEYDTDRVVVKIFDHVDDGDCCICFFIWRVLVMKCFYFMREKGEEGEAWRARGLGRESRYVCTTQVSGVSGRSACSQQSVRIISMAGL
jgi:hypothetical protein